MAPHFPDDGSAMALLDALDLAPALLEQTVATVSTGERQRLALVRVLLLDPAVLLLDEPTSALDGAAAMRVEAMLRVRLADGVSILLVTHDSRLVGRMAHRRLCIRDGVLGPDDGP